MKVSHIVAIALLAVLSGTVLSETARAQEDVSGTWAGKLAVSADTSLNIQFVLTRAPDGAYSAVVTSPDAGGIKNVAASSVRYVGNELELTVEELNGAYRGVLEDGGFNGEWRQEGSAIPLRLTPYEKPELSQAARDALTGSWVGRIEGPAGSVTLVYRFETNPAGEFVGYLDSPDQGARGVPLEGIEFSDGEVHFTIPRARADYSATVGADEMTGTWKQVTAEVPLTMKRGEYAPPESGLSDAAKQALAGSWVGTLESPGGPLNVVYRFESNADGRFVGFFDSPDQGVRGLPITEIELADEALRLTIPGVRAEYSATFAAGRMDGTFKQGPNERALAMSPGSYTPTAKPLDLSAEAQEQLAGSWRGRLGPTEVVVRFQTNDGGAYVGLFSVPAQGVMDLPVSSANLADGRFTLSIAPLQVTYTADFAGTEMSGRWQQGPGANIELSLKHE